MLIASTLDRLLEELPSAELAVELDEDKTKFVVRVASAELAMELSGDKTKVVVGVASGELAMELDETALPELTVPEADAGLVPEVADVVGVGGVAVKRAVAAVVNKSLASPVMRVQKSGRRPDWEESQET